MPKSKGSWAASPVRKVKSYRFYIRCTDEDRTNIALLARKWNTNDSEAVRRAVAMTLSGHAPQ